MNPSADASPLTEPDPDTLRAWLLEALHAEGVDDAELDGDAIVLPNGLGIDAEFGEAKTIASGKVKSTTRTMVWHADFPEGLIEYQHSVGHTLREATIHGFRQWVRLDLEPIEDALPGAEQHCLHLNFEFPATDAAPARRRRVVLGPPVRQARGGAADADEDHPFCSCCLFTQAGDAFSRLLASDEVMGLRLFAMRNDDGTFDADCRVNGVDFPPGAEALRAYAATWPGSGLELRKQYAVLCAPGIDAADPRAAPA